MNLSQEIGLRLKSYRIDNNLTQTQLAKKLGIVNSTLSKYESDGISDIDTINSISMKLKTNLMEYKINESLMKDGMENPFVDFGMIDFEDSVDELLSKRDKEIKDWTLLKKYNETAKNSTKYCAYTESELNDLISLAYEYKNDIISRAKKVFIENFKNVLLAYAYNLYLMSKNIKERYYIKTTYEFFDEIEQYKYYSENFGDKYFLTLDESFEKLSKVEEIENNKEAYFLLRALYRYFIENDELPQEYKNLTNITKLLRVADVNENDTCSQSPLDKLFARLEEKNKNSLAVEMYKNYQTRNIQKRRDAIMILLYYIQKCIEEQVRKELHCIKTVGYDKDVSKYFKKNELCEGLGFQTYEKKTKRSIRGMINFGSEKSNIKNSSKFKEEDLESIMNSINRIILKKGEVIANEGYSGSEDIDFNFIE